MAVAMQDLLSLPLKHEEIGIEQAADYLEHMTVAQTFSTKSLAVYFGNVPNLGPAIIMIPALGSTLLLTPA